MSTLKTARRRRSTYIESLESRIAPATLIVTNLNDSGAGSLRDAIDQANSTTAPDVIKFEAGLDGTINVGAEMLIETPLTIQGPSSLTIKLNGGGADRIFRLDDGLSETAIKVAISNLVLQNGKADQGGGIYAVEALTLTNTVISGSESTSDGGGLFVETTGKLTINNSQFLSNVAANSGGAADLTAAGGISISRTLFVGNDATTNLGGAMRINQSATGKDVTISSSVFSGNTSGDDGGALYFDHNRNGAGAKAGKFTISNSTFINNVGQDEGGAISNDDGQLIVKGSLFRGNSGPSGGAIFHSSDETLNVSGSQFIDNSTTGDGGAIGISYPTNPASISKSTFIGNSATSDGGAVMVHGATLKVTSSTFSGNSAAIDGGAITGQFGSSLNIAKSIFTGNLSDRGGAIQTSGSGTDATNLVISGSTFSLNGALYGGAVDATGDGAIRVSKSKVRGNFTTAEDGGGFYLRSDTSISIVSTLFDANESADDGGGLALGGAGTMSIAKSIFTNNFIRNGDDGGAIAKFGGAPLTITGSKITGNYADNQGGGIFVSAGTFVIKSTKISGNFAPFAPDLYT